MENQESSDTTTIANCAAVLATDENIATNNDTALVNDNEEELDNLTGAEEAGEANDPGKMFVGGLSWQTTPETLRAYFAKFGDLNECLVVKDPTTKRARGFGFITFVDPSSVDKVLAQSVHELDGKKIDPKVAFPKKAPTKPVTRTKKIFIGGLAATSSVEDMKNYFSQFGKIEEAMLMFDKSTNRHRGFGFICFDSEDVVEKICEIHFHEINGKMVECKKAQPKEVMLPAQLEKSRAALTRSLYGLPEQLLATYAAAACVPRVGYNPGTIIYPAPNYYGLMLAPGDKVFPADLATLSPPALALGARPDWSRSIFNAAAVTPTGYISAPTSPTTAPMIQQQRAAAAAALNLAAAAGLPGHLSVGGPMQGHHHHHHHHAAQSPVATAGHPHHQTTFEFYPTAAAGSNAAAASGGADLTSLITTASPQNLPQFQFKTSQLIATYNGFH